PRGDIECPPVAGQPARLLDALHDRRWAARVEPYHTTTPLLGDQDAAERVDRDAHRALEPERDDARCARIKSRDGAGVTIRDVDAIVGVDCETAEASESVGDHLEWSKRADRRGRRRDRSGDDR